MSKGRTDLPKDDLPLENEDFATFQEAIPVPYLAGKRKIAVRWIAPAAEMVTKKAKTPTGKK